MHRRLYGYTDRRLDVDGIINNPGNRPRAGAHARVREGDGLLCTWREACKAVDTVLENFGDPQRDRGIWVWYCQRIGLNAFFDIADEVTSCWRQGEIRWPVRAFQKHLQETLPKGGAR